MGRREVLASFEEWKGSEPVRLPAFLTTTSVLDCDSRARGARAREEPPHSPLGKRARQRRDKEKSPARQSRTPRGEPPSPREPPLSGDPRGVCTEHTLTVLLAADGSREEKV
eukprot:CAMPEP_0206237610 /NCGR_PEP_ID=MMETSP0047_2-20121206/14360_1 /ASSEMBLY_ACC=CAM_ASM_000192 /TAXON_ID=195065 /ORGANISM="Chroomonas mesostigmatica_cf, Strain CCMP1168" /LENGTH=111 /DNA_ID=CAMNT_0053662063 /DNA_START=1406 /DNA_END=1738 /DNA_ORIENTATION=-